MGLAQGLQRWLQCGAVGQIDEMVEGGGEDLGHGVAMIAVRLERAERVRGDQAGSPGRLPQPASSQPRKACSAALGGRDFKRVSQ